MNPSLVLVQPRKTRPDETESLLMGRKEPNQTNKNRWINTGQKFTSLSLFSLLFDQTLFKGFPVNIVNKCISDSFYTYNQQCSLPAVKVD